MDLLNDLLLNGILRDFPLHIVSMPLATLLQTALELY